MMDWPVLIILILFMGFFLLLIEVFIVPGFGPVGVGAIVFIATGTYLSWTKLSSFWGITVTLISIFSVVLSIYLLQKMGVAKRFVLSQNITQKSSSDTKGKATEGFKNQSCSIGDRGLTISDLRPSGIAEFGNNRIDVIADGIYIKRGTKIRVVRIEGNKVFVEEEGVQ